jgi:O-antigen ligase
MLTVPPSYRWYRDPLYLARLLVLGNLLFLLFSPPVTNLAEGLLYLLVLTVPRVRRQVLSAVRQPMVAMSLLFGACLIVATFYGPAPRAEAISMITGWRRLLLLPIAAGLFNESEWKTRTLWIFIVVLDLAALVSYGLLLTHTHIANLGPAISVRNYVTQSMTFSVGVFSAAMLLKQSNVLSSSRKGFLLVSILLLASNALFVMMGRSAYLVMAVCGVAYALSFLPKERFGIKHLAAVVLPIMAVCIAVLLVPISRDRLQLALNQAEHYQTEPGVTSVGIRIIFLKNTLKIIEKHPLFGVGTGGFRVAYEQQVADVKGWQATSTTDPHNQFLKIFAEEGIVGLAIFLAFIASAFWQPVAEPFRILGLGVLCGWCATSLFNSHFSTFSEGRFIFVWCGIMLGAISTIRPKSV